MRSKLPEELRGQIDEVSSKARELHLVKSLLETISQSYLQQQAIISHLEQFIPNIYVIGIGFAITTLIASFLKKKMIKETLLIIRDLGI